MTVVENHEVKVSRLLAFPQRLGYAKSVLEEAGTLEDAGEELGRCVSMVLRDFKGTTGRICVRRGARPRAFALHGRHRRVFVVRAAQGLRGHAPAQRHPPPRDPRARGGGAPGRGGHAGRRALPPGDGLG